MFSNYKIDNRFLTVKYSSRSSRDQETKSTNNKEESDTRIRVSSEVIDEDWEEIDKKNASRSRSESRNRLSSKSSKENPNSNQQNNDDLNNSFSSVKTNDSAFSRGTGRGALLKSKKYITYIIKLNIYLIN